MCRCCQSCLEDIYWNCIEEKFCYDESIANYNPDEDDFVTKDHIKIMTNNGSNNFNGRPMNERQIDNNNMPICTQPLNRNNSLLVPSGKIHEEDYRREIQTSVSILAPEILAVFANSQIFQEHQAKGLPRINTKSYLPIVHGTSSSLTAKDKFENNQEKLLYHLEGATTSSVRKNHDDDNNSNKSYNINDNDQELLTTTTLTDKKIKFTIADNSPLELMKTPTTILPAVIITPTTESTITNQLPLNYYSSIDEKLEDIHDDANDNDDLILGSNNPKYISDNNIDKNEVILRPRLRTQDNTSMNSIKKNPSLLDQHQHQNQHQHQHQHQLRNVQSFSYFSVRPVASENDIFLITGSGGSYNQLSMTPEVPSISYSALPKNYEDTPTIEKYKESVSLFSIQAANQAQANNKIIDYSMPRYFRKTMTQSVENFQSGSLSNHSSRDNIHLNVKRPEKSRRLKNLRDSLPPLLIHNIRKKDETKQVN